MLISCGFPNNFPFPTFLVDYLFLFVCRDFSHKTAITFLCLLQILSFLFYVTFFMDLLYWFYCPLPSREPTRLWGIEMRRKITLHFNLFLELSKVNRPVFPKKFLWITRCKASINTHTHKGFSGQISLGKAVYYISFHWLAMHIIY